MTKLARLLVLTTALVATLGCEPNSKRRADKAAAEVAERREELEKAKQDVAADQVDLAQKSRDVVGEAGELAKAEQEFARRRAARIAALVGELEVIASQPQLIGTMAAGLAITDAARGDINERLSRFKQRLEEARNLVEGLEKTDASIWESRDDEATDAMKRLEDSRKEAWDSLEDAPHIDHSGS